MAEPTDIVVREAGPADGATLANLLELYMHDLSEFFPIDVGADGRFGYDRLALYWQEPERRFAYLITADARVAGLILATRGSPLTDDPRHLDVAEFFVLRRYRRAGVGRRAAFQLWDRLAGTWVVRVAETNQRGLAFWRAAIAEYAGPASIERRVERPERAWRVFEFPSRAKPLI